MTFIKFLFAILIVLPVGIILYFLLRKLVDEYNAAVKKSQELELRRKEAVQAPAPRDYRRDNPRYDAYRKKMEHRQTHTANIEGEQSFAEGQEKSERQALEGIAGENRGKQSARSKRKRRKERKNKKKNREKDNNQ